MQAVRRGRAEFRLEQVCEHIDGGAGVGHELTALKVGCPLRPRVMRGECSRARGLASQTDEDNEQTREAKERQQAGE
jgi:hypothetical protein